MLPSPADCAGKERVLQLASTSTLQQVFSNECTFAALRVDGSVITWGDPDGSGDSSNVSEFLEARGKGRSMARLRLFATMAGDDASGGESSAVRQQLRSGVKQACSTRGSMAAFKEDGTVVCSENPQSGGNAETPHLQQGFAESRRFAQQGATFAALKEDGSVHAWGDEKHGADTTATESILGFGVTKLFGNNVSFAAIKSNGGIVSWGDPARGPPLVHPRVPDVKKNLRDEVRLGRVMPRRGCHHHVLETVLLSMRSSRNMPKPCTQKDQGLGYARLMPFEPPAAKMYPSVPSPSAG